MNVTLTNKIYDTLKLYLQARSSYAPRVVKLAKQEENKFPLVVITESNNIPSERTLKAPKREITSNIYYEINIYAEDKAIGNKTISKAQICDEIKVLTDKVMSGYFQLDRTLCEPTPNLDSNIYRLTMRYTAKIFENKNRLI